MEVLPMGVCLSVFGMAVAYLAFVAVPISLGEFMGKKEEEVTKQKPQPPLAGSHIAVEGVLSGFPVRSFWA
jgi:hypothetical protein